MKKILILLLVVLLVVSTIPVVALANVAPSSTMSNQACLAFLQSENIAIPTFFSDDEQAAEFAKYIISLLEQNPNRHFAFGFSGYNQFAEQIKSAVVGDSFPAMASYGDGRDQLLYSTFYSWPTGCGNFNCYAYALGRSDDFYYPGSFVGATYQPYWDVEQSARHTYLDLTQGLGFDCVKQHTTLPNLDVPFGTNVIALRVANLPVNGIKDYHFMRLNRVEGNYWNHKPGGTAVLTFNLEMSNSIPWTNERIEQDIHLNYEYKSAFIEYDSNIVYFTFRRFHAYTEEYIGSTHGIGVFENVHYDEYRKECSNCGDVVVYYESRECTGICPIRPIDPGIVVDGVGGEQNEEN